MTKVESGKPDETEYAVYYGRYVGKIEGVDIVAVLYDQLQSTLSFLRGIDDRTADFRYAPGKWSVKEVIGHVIDAERVFAYRALAFARNESTSLPGFDENQWAAYANYSSLSMNDILTEFETVRRSTLLLFRQMDTAAWNRRGNANGNDMTTRSAAFVIAGHLQHHLEMLKSRYLNH
jgi:DinB superfamily